MSDMQDQMNAILGNPEMMGKIMELAQNFNKPTKEAPPPQPVPQHHSDLPNIDLSMVQKLSGLASQSNIDSNQRTLINALGPYLTRSKIQKLEKAMRAAKIASIASVFLNQNGLNFSGR